MLGMFFLGMFLRSVSDRGLYFKGRAVAGLGLHRGDLIIGLRLIKNRSLFLA